MKKTKEEILKGDPKLWSSPLDDDELNIALDSGILTIEKIYLAMDVFASQERSEAEKGEIEALIKEHTQQLENCELGLKSISKDKLEPLMVERACHITIISELQNLIK